MYMQLAYYFMSGIPVAKIGQAMRIRAEQIEQFAEAGDLPYTFVETLYDADTFEITAAEENTST
jgi:hypothetical protein